MCTTTVNAVRHIDHGCSKNSAGGTRCQCTHWTINKKMKTMYTDLNEARNTGRNTGKAFREGATCPHAECPALAPSSTNICSLIGLRTSSVRADYRFTLEPAAVLHPLDGFDSAITVAVIIYPRFMRSLVV